MTDKTPAPPAAPTTDAQTTTPETTTTEATASETTADAALKGPEQKPGEIGGPNGPEPTRYGDWEFKGRCSDF